MRAFHDLETRSTRNIKAGPWAYAEGAKVLLWAYAIDDGLVQVWDLTTGDPMPEDLYAALQNPECIHVWHNGGMFDLPVLQTVLNIRFDPYRIHDTLAIALAHSLPGALGKLCEVLRVPDDLGKDKDGKRLIRMFCIPRKDGKFNDASTHPEDWKKFIDYARLDIEAMRVIYAKLPKWNLTPFERRVWAADQAINARGIAVDVELAKAAIVTVDAAQVDLAERTTDLTLGIVGSATQRSALLAFLNDGYGLGLEDLRGPTVEKALERDDLPPEVRELLVVRSQASTTSTAKYRALLDCVCGDGRLRGAKQFCGASRTARWAGRLFQPDNLPRSSIGKFKGAELQAVIETGIGALKAGHADLLFSNVMELTSAALRGVLIPGEGRKLAVADLSNIEGRVLAWLAGEQWKLDAFARGEDLYKVTAGRILGKKTDEITEDERQQVGKVSELALGFGGGPGAFVTFAVAYNIDIDRLADTARETLAPSVVAESTEGWDWAKDKGVDTRGLERETWIGVDAIKRAWRKAHPKITAFWRDLEEAAALALSNPSMAYEAGKVTLLRHGAWLRMVLPSDRSLCYPAATVKDGVITYMGTNQFTRKFERIHTYGGKLSENATQAVARDILAHGLVLAEEGGFEPVMHVHDEIIAENCTADELVRVMSVNPTWADGLPLAAKGFECARYRK